MEYMESKMQDVIEGGLKAQEELAQRDDPAKDPQMTLDELAWLERCAFPGDLAKEFLERLDGIRPDKDNAYMARMCAEKICQKGYVKAWQEIFKRSQLFPGFPEARVALLDHVRDMLTKYRSYDHQSVRNQPGTRPAPPPSAG